MSVKIAVGIIVFEGDYVFKQCLDQIYPYVEQILITEGPVRFWQNLGKTTSTDNTNDIIDNYNDYASKIKVIHGQFEEKTEECNAYIPYIRDDIDYLWQIDSDEIYTIANIEKIKKVLIEEKPTSVGVKSCTFYGGFNNFLTGFEQNNDNFLRIFKFEKGSYWETHRPPTIHYPNGIERKHISSDELFSRWGIEMHHYSYVFPTQVKNKMEYYSKSLNVHNIIPNYFNDVYWKWVNGDDNIKNQLEQQYAGVHEFLPHNRGPCFTNLFIDDHPESIIRDFNLLKTRFNEEVKFIFNESWKDESIPQQQLDLNLIQLNDKQNYPPHWINLINLLNEIDNSNEIMTFVDVACGVGSSYKLLQENNFKFSYKGLDYSDSMIRKAISQWNNDNIFNVNNVFQLSVFEKKTILYADGLLDILENSKECLLHLLTLNSDYIILNRIRLEEKYRLSKYYAYGRIFNCFSYEKDDFYKILNDSRYTIIKQLGSDDSLTILLKYN